MTSEEVLGFNPKQSEYKCQMITVTPKKAQYILDKHNNDNRDFYKTQFKALDKSLGKHGWCYDGSSMSFNTNGQLTEFQHRLDRIVYHGLTVTVPVMLGIEPEVQQKIAPPKARTPVDAIFRKDRSVVKDDESVLRQFLFRRGGEKLNMENAVDNWRKYKPNVLDGRKIGKIVLKKKTSRFQSWKKEIQGFCALMSFIKKEDVARNLLNILQAHIDGKETTLSKGFEKYKETEVTSGLDISGPEKSNTRFLMLCAAADRIIESPDGMIEFGLTREKCVHEKMKTKTLGSVYRKFLVDPDNIGNKAYITS